LLSGFFFLIRDSYIALSRTKCFAPDPNDLFFRRPLFLLGALPPLGQGRGGR